MSEIAQPVFAQRSVAIACNHMGIGEEILEYDPVSFLLEP